MNDGRTAGAGGFVRRLGRTLRTTLDRRSGEAAPAPRTDRTDRKTAARERRERLAAELAEVREAVAAADAQLEELTTERDRLREERLRVQEELGEQHGMRVMPRLKVEKTNGVPSFVVGQRMMQRIHGRAEDPRAGLDGAGSVLGERAGTVAYARSHGVPVLEQDPAPAGRSVVVHAFKGEVGLVEVRGPGGVRHLTERGEDPGDIRPAATYDPGLAAPEELEQICGWSRVLSAHVPRPYVQLVWAEDPARLDRIDLDPDRIPVLTPEWDRRLGSVFDGAYTRFLLQPYRGGGLANRVPGGTFSYEEGA